MATTPKQTRDEKVLELYNIYQDSLTKKLYYKDRADSMQAVIATAGLGSDIVNWRGEIMTKSQLQGYQSDNQSKYDFWNTQSSTFKSDYEDYLAYAREQDNLEFITANPALAPELAGIAAQQQTETAIGIAAANANAIANQEANALQAKGAAEVAAANAKRNNIIIIVVVVVVVVSVGLVLWKKFKKS